ASSGWTLQSTDQAAQEDFVEAKLAGGGALLEQCRADLHQRDRCERFDRRLSLRAAHVAGLAEAIAFIELTDRIAAAHDGDAPRHDDVEAIVHLAFFDDLLALLVVLPRARAQHFEDLGLREVVEELER